MYSITTDVNCHTERHDLEIDCRTLATDSGRPFTLLTVGPIRFYSSRDQLRQIRDVITDYLGDESDDRQTPPEQPPALTHAESRRPPMSALTAHGWPHGRRDAGDGTDLRRCSRHPCPFEPTAEDWADYRRSLRRRGPGRACSAHADNVAVTAPSPSRRSAARLWGD